MQTADMRNQVDLPPPPEARLRAAIERTARRRNISPEQVVSELVSILEQPAASGSVAIAELRHRFKNELHFLAASMRLRHRWQNGNADCRACIGQVTALSHLNDALDDAATCHNVDIGAQCLCFAEVIRQAFHLDTKARRLEIETEPLMVPREVARNVLLILNEAVTNAVKHAFDASGGIIRVRLQRSSDSEAHVIVEDYGSGETAICSTGKGQTLIRIFAAEIDADLDFSHGPAGCRLECRFPVAPVRVTGDSSDADREKCL